MYCILQHIFLKYDITSSPWNSPRKLLLLPMCCIYLPCAVLIYVCGFASWVFSSLCLSRLPQTRFRVFLPLTPSKELANLRIALST